MFLQGILQKKHDMRKGHASETSDGKERKEPLRSHYEESHHKRRRSQSREREDKRRRSISLSPKAYKRALLVASRHVNPNDQKAKDGGM